MLTPKNLLRLLLAVILAVSVCSLFAMRKSIAETEAEQVAKEEQLRLLKLSNQEMSSILDEENEEDFYRDIAEQDLHYGDDLEKLYLYILGQ